MPARETMDYEDVLQDLGREALKVGRGDIKVGGIASDPNYVKLASMAKTSEEPQKPQDTAAQNSSELFHQVFSHPEDSPQRLQAFSKYLKALRDEHASR